MVKANEKEEFLQRVRAHVSKELRSYELCDENERKLARHLVNEGRLLYAFDHDHVMTYKDAYK